MKKFLSFFTLTICFCLAISNESNAQSYEFLFSQNDYNVTEGSTVDLTLLLRETVSGGETARLAAGGSDGLFAFGVNVGFGGTSGGSTIAAETDVAINAIFDNTLANDVSLVGSSADIRGATSDAANGVDGSDLGSGIFELELATITVTAGDVGTITSFNLADHTDGGVETIFTDATIIDGIATYGSANVTVVAIPEPATATMLLFGTAGICLRRRRK